MTAKPTPELSEHHHLALGWMQREQARRVRILCMGCGEPMVAWNQGQIEQGKVCEMCLELSKLKLRISALL